MTLVEDWAAMPQGQAAESYARLICRRATDGMLSDDWTVDWSRSPLTHAVHPSSTAFEMPLPGTESAIFAKRFEPTAAALAEVLHVALGITAQRLVINLNDTHDVYARADSAKWGRTTASGGGRYCGDVYLVESGRSSGTVNGERLPEGIYHYSILHHAWELLSPGDHTDAVAAAQGYESTAQRYLLTTINYWRSGFKYNDFAYQATAMDMGTIAGSLCEVLGPELSRSWDMWVAEVELAALLGLDPFADGVYAVQAWGTTRPAQPRPAPPRTWPDRTTGQQARTTAFLTTRALQRDMTHTPDRPDEFAAPDSLPEVDTTSREKDWLRCLCLRESSFGRFTGAPISAGSLMTVLSRADEVGTWVATGCAARWEFLVYVNTVDGLAPGLYAYCRGELRVISEEPQNEFLASTYFLRNYDGYRAAATVVFCANVFEAARRWGVRGYRHINAVVGAMCQAFAVDAVRHRIGTGTALGFDALRHAQHAGMETARMSPLLMMMVGVDDEASGRFHTTTSTLSSLLEDPA